MPFTAYPYAFYLSFSTKMPCILHHFTLRLAPKRTAFCTKTPCILHQNALHLAAYCTAFSTKTHRILLQIAQKRVLVAVCLNKNSFWVYVQLTVFLHQTKPSLESIFCGKVSRWLAKRALIMLKFTLKSWQNFKLTSWHVNELTSVMVRAFASWGVGGVTCLWVYETSSLWVDKFMNGKWLSS